MLLRLHQKKERCQHLEIFVGLFCFFCVIYGLRGGVVFSGPLPEGWALVRQVGWLLCLQDKKKKSKSGRAESGFGKDLL